MEQRSRNGFCARVVPVSRHHVRRARREIGNLLARWAAQAQDCGSDLSNRGRKLLARCAAAAAPQVGSIGGRPALETLEGRTLLSGSTPYLGHPFNIATDTIQAENFDNGGEGVAYHDTTPQNLGGQYRNTGVDIVSSGANGLSVGYTAAGEWLNYSIDVPSSGTYALQATVADAIQGGTFHAAIDGANVTGSISVPNTGGWYADKTLQSGSFALSAGTHVLQIHMDSNDAWGEVGDFNSFKFVAANTSSASATPPPISTPSGASPYLGHPFNVPADTIEAENFDNGGEGVAYHDTTPQNLGGQYRNTGVDIVGDGSNGASVGYTAAGEWLDYTINAPSAGTYAIQANVADAIRGGTFHAEIDGANVTGSMAVPNTGGWYTHQTVQSGAFNLSSGTHVLRIRMDSNDAWGEVGDFDYFKFVAASNSNPSSTPTPTPNPSSSSGSVVVNGENSTVYGSNHGDWQAPTPVIQLLGNGGQAEHSVFVDALSSNLGSGTPLTAQYQWNFGDPGSRFNVLPGWNAGHIYDNPGTYTVTLTITNDAGKTSSVSTQLTIGGNSRRTIYVDAWGNDGNSGLSPNSPVRTWRRANQLSGDNTTVLFHRGEEFDFDDSFQINNRNLVIGAYGSGSAPVMMKVPGPGHGIFYMGPSSDQVVIENLAFDSVWKPQGNIANEIDAVGVYPNGHNITVRDNTFYNVNSAVDAYQGPTGFLLEDNSAPLQTGIRGYFEWMNGTEQVIVGNYVANSTREHIMRSSSPDTTKILIAGNNFDKPNRQNVDPNDAQKTTINIRAGSYIYVADNQLADAAVVFGPDGSLSADTSVEWIVMDGNRVHNAQIYLHGSVHHAEVRNNLTDVEVTQQIWLDTDDPTYSSRHMYDVTVEHNTGVLQGNIGVMLMIDGSNSNSIVVKNNLFSAPNLQPGNDFAASVVIHAWDVRTVSLFSHNVWAPSWWGFHPVQGGVNFIAPVLDPNHFCTAQEWNAMGNVQDDQFRTVWTGGNSFQTAIDGQMAGALLPALLS